MYWTIIMQSLIQFPSMLWGSWSSATTWGMYGGGCMQASAVYMVPLQRECDNFSSPWPDLCKILPVGFSDHSVIVYDAFTRNISPKSAYWHFNYCLVSDHSFKEFLMGFFVCVFSQRKNDFACLRQWWDQGKTHIKQLCQQQTLNLTCHITRSIKDLKDVIVETESLPESTGHQRCIEVLKTKKKGLDNLLHMKVQGALVWSRYHNINDMDAPSSFFFSLEKKSEQRKSIHSLLFRHRAGADKTRPDQS